MREYLLWRIRKCPLNLGSGYSRLENLKSIETELQDMMYYEIISRSSMFFRVPYGEPVKFKRMQRHVVGMLERCDRLYVVDPFHPSIIMSLQEYLVELSRLNTKCKFSLRLYGG